MTELLCDFWPITQKEFRGLSDVALTKSFPFPFNYFFVNKIFQALIPINTKIQDAEPCLILAFSNIHLRIVELIEKTLSLSIPL